MDVTNKKTISKLFLERSQFVLIGLTGRTGSGCTTAANIYESQSPDFPDYGDLLHEDLNFYGGLDKARYEIAKKYASFNWKQFYSIKVSDLLSAYLLTLKKADLISFISVACKDKSISKNKIDITLTDGAFSKNFITREFSDFQEFLTEHNGGKTEFSDERLGRFIRYLKLVRKFTSDFKSELKKLGSDVYISVYQALGISVRKLGKVDIDYENHDFDPDSVFHLPETVNRVIKLIRQKEKQAFIVIDAIRNPYEARFFRDRYSAFYLVSINAPDEDRKAYLQSVHKFTPDQLKIIDQKESGKEKADFNEFIGQDVKRCIEISDIHLFNPRNQLDNQNILKAQIAWYFSLMIHPGLITPTSMERVMQMAYTAKTNSGCISRQVGAVITDENNSIKAVGWNDVPEGQYPCALRSADKLLTSFNPDVYSHYEMNDQEFRDVVEKKYIKIIPEMNETLSGRNLAYCFKDLKNNTDNKGNQVHTRSLHAEENAFLQVTKYGGQAIQGGKLYTTASPCELCAKKAYQLGIKDIIYIDPYPGIAKEHVITIGKSQPNLIQFRGAVGRGYHQLYEQTLPYKDELDYFLGEDSDKRSAL